MAVRATCPTIGHSPFLFIELHCWEKQCAHLHFPAFEEVVYDTENWLNGKCYKLINEDTLCPSTFWGWNVYIMVEAIKQPWGWKQMIDMDIDDTECPV